MKPTSTRHTPFSIRSFDFNALPHQMLLTDAKFSFLTEIEQSVNLLNYNSFTILLELASFIQKKRQSHPKIGWIELWNQFTFTPASLIEKYKGSSTDMMVWLLHSYLAAQGYESSVITESHLFHEPFYLPIVDASLPELVPWNCSREYLKGYSNLLCLVPYQEGSTEKMIVLGALKSEQALFKVYDSMDAFLSAFRRYNVHEIALLDDLLGYLKCVMQTSLVFEIYNKKAKKYCRFNLLDGRFDIEDPVWSGVKNSNKESIFNVIALHEHPTHLIEVIRDEKPITMSSLELLHILLEQLQHTFDLPVDFKENFLFLLHHRRELFQEILLPSCKLLLDIWPLFGETAQLRQKLEEVAPVSESDPDFHVWNEAESHYRHAKHAMGQGDSIAIEELLEAREMYEKALNAYASKQRVPVDVLLNTF